MDDIKYVPLDKFQIEPSLDDKFWEEKVKRMVDECNSVSTLKEIVYGKSTFGGITGTNAFSAKAPWPISLLFGPLIG